MTYPSYISLCKNGELDARAKIALTMLENCKLCPRKCGVNRKRGEIGFCKTGRYAKIASYAPHFGEESVLSGTRGSGTIFISGCNLLCAFCQNYSTSHAEEGYEVSAEKFADIMITLMKLGCHNINIVTPSHIVPQFLESLPLAVEKGLNIPIVYNCGGYENTETLKLLNGIVDIYMPDFKFWENKWAKLLCNAEDYRDYAVKAVIEMHSQVGDLIIDNHIAKRGLLIRHLVMPNNIADTYKIMSLMAKKVSPHTAVNIMDQYYPCANAYKFPVIARRISQEEYHTAVEATRKTGIYRLIS
mgnify:CR=1 FL=1